MLYVKRIFFSFICGLFILLLTGLYQNFDFTFTAEDKFFKQISIIKDKWTRHKKEFKVDFIFVNTGKDLALVEDTLDYGNVAISDREKLYQLMSKINLLQNKPAYTVIDLQFYYPYSINPSMDSLLQVELNKNPDLVIPVVKGSDGAIKKPIYNARYASSDYLTFGSGLNRFSLMRYDSIPSIPVLLHSTLQKVEYKKKWFLVTCNDTLCNSSIWPTYYYNNSSVRKNMNNAQYYNLGEMVMDMEADMKPYEQVFKNRVLIIGNFEEDMHTTPAGKMSGPVLLANIYLSLLNRQHYLETLFVIIVLVSFTGLSYVALYGNMPGGKLNFKFLFSSVLNKYAKKYLTYFGSMFLLSLLLIWLFDKPIGLFLPPFLFSGVEYLRHKKYKEI